LCRGASVSSPLNSFFIRYSKMSVKREGRKERNEKEKEEKWKQKQ
jgi:hypothetical protein